MSDTVQVIAEQVAQWLEEDLGTRYITALSVKYNQLHQEAESDNLTIEQKALKIERAAGVKWAIDWLQERRLLAENAAKQKAAEADEA